MQSLTVVSAKEGTSPHTVHLGVMVARQLGALDQGGLEVDGRQLGKRDQHQPSADSLCQHLYKFSEGEPQCLMYFISFFPQNKPMGRTITIFLLNIRKLRKRIQHLPKVTWLTSVLTGIWSQVPRDSRDPLLNPHLVALPEDTHEDLLDKGGFHV